MILVTGASGQLGSDVIKELNKRNIAFFATDIRKTESVGFLDDTSFKEADLTKESEVKELFSLVHPDAVIHCAAWTLVDDAEDEDKKEKVYAVNVTATENIACACKEHDSKLMYLSTDYVFNGEGNDPWDEECTDYDPVNYYGYTKMQGELAVKELKKFFIVRISWVFGKNGTNFPRTIAKVASTHESIKVVNDQIGNPTYTPDLARLLADMVQSEKYGIYHTSNEGEYISWYDIACEVVKVLNLKCTVTPVSSEEYGFSKAKRPKNSRLMRKKLKENGFEPLPEWKNALRRFFVEEGLLEEE